MLNNPQAIALTKQQRNIIEAPSGHYVVRAVAGSGKTTTLAHRIQYLLEHGADPRRILVLMFNKSAQLDFQSKLAHITAQGQAIPEVRTFHAMGFRLYKRFIELGALPGYQPRILSEREIQYQLLQLVGQVLTGEQQTEFKRYKKEYLDVSATFIDQCKGQLEDAHTFFKSSGLEQKFAFLPSLFERFEVWRKEQKRISFADMLYDPVCAMLATPELVDLVSNKVDTILVDEYQDTNDIQHTLLSIIAGERAKVTIVGDPDQTIYEFRGAKPQYMLSGFAEEFEGSQSLNLSKSFRYGHQVALLANQLIAQSGYHDGTLCQPGPENPITKVTLKSAPNELDALLDSLTQENHQSSAILVRYWSQTAKIELALLSKNISYALIGHDGIFGSEPMIALRALLELASGIFALLTPAQRMQKLLSLGRFPHLGISERTQTEIFAALSQKESRWGHHLLSLLPDGISRYQRLKLERMARALSAIEHNMSKPHTIFSVFANEVNLIDEIKSSGLSQDASEEQARTIEDLIDYLGSLRTENAHQLLDELAELEHRTKQSGLHPIQITTIHRAKGLEWDQVILPGLTEANFFSSTSRKDITEQDIAGERRLLYVAMTRAKHRLIMISHPKDRLRFVSEMRAEESLKIAAGVEGKASDCRLTQAVSPTAQRYADAHGLQLCIERKERNASEDSNPIWVRPSVKHTLFGEGRVVSEASETFTVEFAGREQRVFSKDFAERMFEAS